MAKKGAHPSTDSPRALLCPSSHGGRLPKHWSAKRKHPKPSAEIAPPVLSLFSAPTQTYPSPFYTVTATLPVATQKMLLCWSGKILLSSNNCRKNWTPLWQSETLIWAHHLCFHHAQPQPRHHAAHTMVEWNHKVMCFAIVGGHVFRQRLTPLARTTLQRTLSLLTWVTAVWQQGLWLPWRHLVMEIELAA